jgi:di/tricarboxylate transporter
MNARPQRLAGAPGASGVVAADLAEKISQRRRGEIQRGFGVLGAVAVLFAMAALDPSAGALYRGAAVMVLLVGLIATKAVPDHVAALAFFFATVTIADIAAPVVFSGFYAGASWLIFAGSIIAVALTESGLSARFARRALGLVGRSYASVIATIALVCLALTFLLPSTAARILLLVPIVLALADSLGYGPDSRARAGMIVATLMLSYLPCASVLTSGNRTLAMVGLAQTLYGKEFQYSDFILWNFPVLTVLPVVITAGLIAWRYREPPTAAAASDPGPAPADHAAQKPVLIIVLGALLLWTTDFIHHVSPAWIGLAAVVALFVAVGRDLPLMEKSRIDYWLMFVAFISLGGVITETGLGARAGASLVSIAGLQADGAPQTLLWNLAAISLISIGVNLIATNLAGPVILVSLADTISGASGLSVETVLIVMMPSFAICPVAFQAPIFLIGMRIAGLPLKELNLCLLAVSGVTVGLLIPLQFLWLWTIGVLP